MIYVYNGSNEELGGIVTGVCAITNDEATLSADLSTLEKLESGVYYLSVNTLNGSNASRSFVRLIAYVRQNFREKLENIGVGNTYAHFMLTLI